MNGKNALTLSVAALCLLTVWFTSIEDVAVYALTYAVLLLWASFFTAGGGMVFQSYWKPLEFVPDYFIGWSTFFVVANSAPIGQKGPLGILTAALIGLVLGDIIGFVSELLGNVMTKEEISSSNQEVSAS